MNWSSLGSNFIILPHLASSSWRSTKWKSQKRKAILASTYPSSNTLHKTIICATNQRITSASQLLSRTQLLILALNSCSWAIMERFSGSKMKVTMIVSSWSFSKMKKHVRKNIAYAKVLLFTLSWQIMRVTLIPTMKDRQGLLSQPYRAWLSNSLSPSHSFALVRSLAYTFTAFLLKVRCLKSAVLCRF